MALVDKARKTYKDFPSTFWVLMAATFIDQVGGALIFPFFALYVTKRFEVGMTEVGTLFVIFTVSGMLGSFIGGAITDRFGRKAMLLFGLVVSAVSSIAMALVDQLAVFYTLGAFVGFLGNAGGPAQQAMVADLLKKEKLTEGYGVQRIVSNLAITIGPAIGGLLAAWSYLALFVIDAVTSIITAIIVYFVLPETKPEPQEDEVKQSMLQTLGGYGKVVVDRLFMSYLSVTLLLGLVYMQMFSTLSVYLTRELGFAEWGYGYALSLNAAMVVLLQVWFTRRIKGRPPMLAIAFGAVFYMIGFAMFGFVVSYALILFAMAVVTVGEMIVFPLAQTLVAQFAPEDMRGRYMAIAGFMMFSIPSAIGPLLAGLIMDNGDPRWVWWAAGILGIFVVAGYLWLHASAGERLGDIANNNMEPDPSPGIGEEPSTELYEAGT